MDNLIFALGRLEDGVRVADEAVDTIGEHDLRDIIMARRCGAILGMFGPRAAIDAATPLTRCARGLALAWAHLVGSFSLGRLGRIADALRAAAAGHAAQAAATTQDDWYLWFHTFVRCQALCQGGRIREAESLGREYYKTGISEQNREERAFFNWHLARVAAERGQVRAAERYAREGTILFRQLGRPAFTHSTLACLALAQALLGMPQDAAASLAELSSLGIEPLWTGVDVLQARAWTAAAAGNLAVGRSILFKAAAFGERVGDLTGAASALHGVARLGAPRLAVTQLDRLGAQLEGDLVAARVAHTHALIADDGDELERVSQIFEAVGADLLAAEAAADGAIAWRHRGDARNAARAQRRATELMVRCPGAQTPALRPVEARALLTRSESDVASLAIQGMSNREIAQALVVSRRTVENHLQKTYKKLGISSRGELEAVLRLSTTPRITRSYA